MAVEQPTRWAGLTHHEWQTLGVIVGLLTTVGSGVAWAVERMGTLTTLIVGGVALAIAVALIARGRMQSRAPGLLSRGSRRATGQDGPAPRPSPKSTPAPSNAGKRRPYEELQQIVEHEGGEMHLEREGRPQGGAWVITLRGRTTVFPSNGAGFPPMDRLYVPNVAEPMHFRDYSNTLVEGAKERFLGMLC